ncbi:MAG: protein kinase [Gemmatimonadetes bacterium]|nr:protein kinase [Gemmatimonadota bacterium]
MTALPPRIGRFEIRSPIGEGGMGTLYLAWDPELQRNVAIKVLRQNDEGLRKRFLREARSAARLQHRNIITVYDVGSHEGQPFIAMEYIPGFTLSTVIDERRDVPVQQKLRWIAELCDGLGYAHAAGIIHRDIKPANLMIDGSGSVQILDFGIARVAQAGGLTQAGMVLGTLNYMSPEQLSGRDIDQRSDIHAVGAVLYELLAYRQAFPGTMADGVVGLILQTQPEPLEKLVPHIPPELCSMVERALQKKPSERYQDLGTLKQDLDRLRQGTAPTVQQATPLSKDLPGSSGPEAGPGESQPASGAPASSRPTVVLRRPSAARPGADATTPPPSGPADTGGSGEEERAPRDGPPWRVVAMVAALVILIPTGFMLFRGDESTLPAVVDPVAAPSGGSGTEVPLDTVLDTAQDSTIQTPDSAVVPQEEAPPPAQTPGDSTRGRVAPRELPAECAELLQRWTLGDLTEEEEEYFLENCR